jgi:cell division protein FtsL
MFEKILRRKIKRFFLVVIFGRVTNNMVKHILIQEEIKELKEKIKKAKKENNFKNLISNWEWELNRGYIEYINLRIPF